ncbi:SDR family NAD(P)-dependent oxidoreductase, partial [Amycolatopsis anabasis]|uniref:SDR family NAD(P)-dependent oxidoreductase n=1 Tax=Amycolatopsis anabasis TaxID=1840409 RepID=UPI00131B2C1F
MTDQRDAVIEADSFRVEETDAGDDVAIVGMMCELPGSARDPEAFWRNLADGRDAVSEIAASRPWLLDELERFWGRGRDEFPRFAAFTDEPAAFDADFFAISPREAQAMDPQQRKGLEATWRALESAGLPPSSLRGGQVGVFAGVHAIDYLDLTIERRHVLFDKYGPHGDTGVHSCLIANRISRWFDFHGPSETINTACSSSLVALSRAVSSVRAGESDLAVVVGVNLLLGARTFAGLDAANMLSPRGRCRTLDAGADGYVRAEGVVALVVKPLRRAIADCDPVHAVIKAAVTNHDGRSSSLRAPNPEAQRRLILDAYRRAGVPVDTVGYVELHGTGTPLGDHVEVTALRQAFAELDPDLPDGGCAVGSAKTNIGHLESGAGLVGVLKVVLSMRHRTLPGLLHFERLNPEIELGPFRPVTGIEPWEPRRDSSGAELPLRASVNSFGYGGANAHAVIEEHRPEFLPRNDDTGPVPVLLSARTEERLGAQADALLARLREHDVTRADLAWTLAAGRDHLEHRLAFVADSIEDAVERLADFRAGRARPGTVTGDARKMPAGVTVFADEPELRDTLLRWVGEGRYERVLELWVHGVDVPWRSALPEFGGRIADLPTYAFARTRHWLPELPELPAPPAAATVATPAAPAPVDDVHLFEETWRLVPGAAGTATGGRSLGRTVVVAPGAALRDDLRRRLAGLGAEALFLVSQDESRDGARPDDHPVDLADVEALGRTLAAKCAGTGLATLLDLRAAADSRDTQDALAPLRLLSAVARSGLRPQVVVLAAAAADDRQLALAESWLGIERSAGQVLPGTRVALSVLDERAGAVPDRIGRVLADAARDRPQATLHDREGRYERHLRPQERPAASAGLRRGGTFLITGGLGGLGLLTARHFAASGAGTLVLTARREPNEQAREAIGEFAAAGVRVITVRADVSDEPGMRRALDDTRATTGPFHGVVHAAGVDPDRQLTEATDDEVRAVLGPKIDGTLLLDRLTEHDPLDFFCMYSSVSAVLGDFGAATYSMGNAFQAAWAARRPGRRAIQWPLWESGGMSLKPSAAAMYRLAGLRAMRTDEGLALLDGLLSGPVAAPLVVTGDDARIAARFGAAAPAAPTAAPPVASLPPSAVSTSDSDSGSGRGVVVGLVAEVLGVE